MRAVEDSKSSKMYSLKTKISALIFLMPGRGQLQKLTTHFDVLLPTIWGRNFKVQNALTIFFSWALWIGTKNETIEIVLSVLYLLGKLQPGECF
jgi:hypothetical protein